MTGSKGTLRKEFDRHRRLSGNMDKLIVRLDRWLKENRSTYYAGLQPGVSEQQLRDFE